MHFNSGVNHRQVGIKTILQRDNRLCYCLSPTVANVLRCECYQQRNIVEDETRNFTTSPFSILIANVQVYAPVNFAHCITLPALYFSGGKKIKKITYKQ